MQRYLMNKMNNNYEFDKLYEYAQSIGCNAVMGESMAKNTSFKTGGPCAIRLSPDSTQQLIDIIRKQQCKGQTYNSRT